MSPRTRIGWILAVAVLVAASLLWRVATRAPASPRPHESGDPPGGLVVADASPREPATVGREPPTVVAAEPLERAPVVVAPTCVVQGVCRAIDGAATSQAFEVTLSLLVDGRVIPSVPASTTVDERFSIAVPWQPNSALFVVVAAEGFVARRGVLGAIDRDEVRDLGEIAVPTGAVVTGLVRDQAGRPAPGLPLTLDAEPAIPVDALGEVGLNRVVLVTGGDGAFAIESGLRRGTWRVRPGGSGVRSSAPERFDVERDPVSLELTVSLGPTIEGMVVDAEGRGVPGVQLEAISPSGSQRQSLLPCSTDAGGAFRLRGGVDAVSGALAQVRLIQGVDRGRWLLEEPAPIAWGTHGHTLVVGHAPILDLQVLDARTGHAIEDYAVSCETGRAVVWRHPGRHPAGKVRIESAGRGPWSLSVLVADLDVPIVLHHPLSPADASRPVVLSVERRSPIVVEVRDVEGPVAGAQVQLCGLAGAAEPERLASARALDRLGSLFNYHGAGPVQFGEAATGAEGLAILREPPEWPFATWLRIESPGRSSRLQRRLPTESGRIVVHLEADAIVTGRIVAMPSDQQGVHVAACPWSEGGEANPGPVAGVAELQADGSFSLSIAPGHHRLWLGRQRGGAQLLGSVGGLRVRAGERLDLGDLRHE